LFDLWCEHIEIVLIVPGEPGACGWLSCSPHAASPAGAIAGAKRTWRETLLIDTGSYLPVLFVSESGDVALAGPAPSSP